MPSRLLFALPLMLILSACQPAAPTASPAVASEAPGNCLLALPAAPLTAPSASLYAQDFAAAPLDATGLRKFFRVARGHQEALKLLGHAPVAPWRLRVARLLKLPVAAPGYAKAA